MICPHCNQPIAGATERDYLAHVGRCPKAPEQRRIGARWAAEQWRDPRPEAEEALRLSVGMRTWGRA
mgnify:FL=1